MIVKQLGNPTDCIVHGAALIRVSDGDVRYTIPVLFESPQWWRAQEIMPDVRQARVVRVNRGVSYIKLE